MLVLVLFSLIVSLAAVYQLNILLMYVNATMYYIRRRKIMTMAISGRCYRRCKKGRVINPRRYWVRPGRTHVWWDNFLDDVVVPEEWRENFRMCKDSFQQLCKELHPHIEKQRTNMREPIEVERQVAVTLYYLSDEGRYRKCANAFGLSRSSVSLIVRRVCHAISIHLGPKYITLPLTEESVKDKVL